MSCLCVEVGLGLGVGCSSLFGRPDRMLRRTGTLAEIQQGNPRPFGLGRSNLFPPLHRTLSRLVAEDAVPAAQFGSYRA